MILIWIGDFNGPLAERWIFHVDGEQSVGPFGCVLVRCCVCEMVSQHLDATLARCVSAQCLQCQNATGWIPSSKNAAYELRMSDSSCCCVKSELPLGQQG